MKKIEQSCPAKVNLLLKVLGKRPDGYHELLTLMQAIDLADTLEVREKGGAFEFSCDNPQAPNDERNLVVKAARLFFAKTGIKNGVAIRLIKKIPVAAGLGGGSSDGANALVALNLLFRSPLEKSVLLELAAQLGSDVPFFICGGAAVCRGRGELVQPLRHEMPLHFVLVNPGIPLSTQEVYASFPERGRSLLTEAEDRLKMIIEGFSNRDLQQSAKAFSNDLEKTALEKKPLLKNIKKSLLQSGGAAVLVSGSGPTVFAVTANRDAAAAVSEQARRLLNTETGFRFFLASGLSAC